jgi:hypothetical protein
LSEQKHTETTRTLSAAVTACKEKEGKPCTRYGLPDRFFRSLFVAGIPIWANCENEFGIPVRFPA